MLNSSQNLRDPYFYTRKYCIRMVLLISLAGKWQQSRVRELRVISGLSIVAALMYIVVATLAVCGAELERTETRTIVSFGQRG